MFSTDLGIGSDCTERISPDVQPLFFLGIESPSSYTGAFGIRIIAAKEHEHRRATNPTGLRNFRQISLVIALTKFNLGDWAGE